MNPVGRGSSLWTMHLCINTTSHTQALDAALIQVMKLGYRVLLNTHVMRRLNDDTLCDRVFLKNKSLDFNLLK